MNMAGGPNASRSVPVTSAQQMQMVMAYANVPAADLRAKGIPERIIQFVEQNRANFQRQTQQQQAFRGMLMKPNQSVPSGQSSEPDRMPPSNSTTQFLSQQNPALPNPLPNSVPRPQQHFMPPNHAMINGGNLGSNNMDTQFARQPQQSGLQGASNGGPAPPTRLPRPTQEQLQHAVTFISKVKHDFMSRNNIQNLQLQNVPDEQKLEFGRMIEQIYRYTQDLEPKLPMYCIMLKQEEMIRKLIAIVRHLSPFFN
jgi:hypothetical protein